jgi:hypothetical protein
LGSVPARVEVSRSGSSPIPAGLTTASEPGPKLVPARADTYRVGMASTKDMIHLQLPVIKQLIYFGQQYTLYDQSDFYKIVLSSFAISGVSGESEYLVDVHFTLDSC